MDAPNIRAQLDQALAEAAAMREALLLCHGDSAWANTERDKALVGTAAAALLDELKQLRAIHEAYLAWRREPSFAAWDAFVALAKVESPQHAAGDKT